MTHPPTIHRGAETLRAIHREASPNVGAMDEATFSAWLQHRLAERQSDPGFALQCRIRDLQRAHRRKIRDRERRMEQARQALHANPVWSTLQELEREAQNTERAVAGLTQAVAEQRADPAKLHAKQQRLAELQKAIAETRANLPEKAQLERAEASLVKLHEDIGLIEARRELEAVQHAQGHRASSSGEKFEQLALDTIRARVLPELQAGVGGELVCLERVTLGCARAEFDLLIVEPRVDHAVVHAVVESKRNPNDLVDGFQMRQENLAWFSGMRGHYKPQAYKTRVFRRGHFDHPVVHESPAGPLVFEPRSFHRMTPDADGVFLRDLYFVTSRRRLLGLTSEELGRLLHRAATDVSLDLTSDNSIRKLWRWAQSFIDPVQTRDVFQMYLDADAADHVLLSD